MARKKSSCYLIEGIKGNILIYIYLFMQNIWCSRVSVHTADIFDEYCTKQDNKKIGNCKISKRRKTWCSRTATCFRINHWEYHYIIMSEYYWFWLIIYNKVIGIIGLCKRTHNKGLMWFFSSESSWSSLWFLCRWILSCHQTDLP